MLNYNNKNCLSFFGNNNNNNKKKNLMSILYNYFTLHATSINGYENTYNSELYQ